jgi:hypothetical protein
MVEERADDLGPEDEIVEKPEEPGLDSTPDLDDLGSPEDALRELEALLNGAGSSIEGDLDDMEPDETPLEAEEMEIEAEQAGEDGVEEDASKDDIWKKIMEQADAVEETGYSGLEDLESLVGETDAAAAIEPESEVDSDEEPAADEEESELEPEAVPVVELDSEIESEAESLLEVETEKEVTEEIDLDQEEELPEGIDLTADEEPAQPEEEEPVETMVDMPGMEIDGALPIAETDVEEPEVSLVEGLETDSIGETEADSPAVEGIEIEGDFSGESSEEIGTAIGEEGMVLGPVELSNEAIEEAAGGLELDSGFDMSTTDEESGDLETADDTADETAPEELEPSSDIEAALQALEGDLDMPPEEEAVAEEPEVMTLEGDSDELEETALDEIAIDDLGEEESEEGGEGEEGEEALPYAADAESEVLAEGDAAQIRNTDDAIKLAIQAEILVAKGHNTEAVRLLEALHLWEPDRASYKERLEELRRVQE